MVVAAMCLEKGRTRDKGRERKDLRHLFSRILRQRHQAHCSPPEKGGSPGKKKEEEEREKRTQGSVQDMERKIRKVL